jgi:hypothetical protein
VGPSASCAALVVNPRAPPDVVKHVQRELFSRLATLNDAQDDGENQLVHPSIQLAQGSLIA